MPRRPVAHPGDANEPIRTLIIALARVDFSFGEAPAGPLARRPERAIRRAQRSVFQLVARFTSQSEAAAAKASVSAS
jgi:hypothetical protein